jgi:N-methylhydantoinase A
MACLVADRLGIETVIVPPSPGVTSAEGLLFTDVRSDHVNTDVQREDQLDVGRLAGEYDKVKQEVLGDLAQEGFEESGTRVDAFADMRYAGQAYEIRVPLPINGGGLDETAVRSAMGTFHGMHDDRYGYSYEGKELVEVVNVGATGLGLFDRPKISRFDKTEGGDWSAALKEKRPAYFREAGGRLELPIYDRSTAPVGVPVTGPCVIEQYDSTLVVEPGWTAQIDPVGQIIVTRDNAQ